MEACYSELILGLGLKNGVIWLICFGTSYKTALKKFIVKPRREISQGKCGALFESLACSEVVNQLSQS